MQPIRTAARALIIQDKKVLAVKMQDKTGIFYILPGGGQEHGETLRESLERECLEELGTGIEISELIYVREYIGKNHEFRNAHSKFHQVEMVFRCTLPDPSGVDMHLKHDKKQIGVEWIPLSLIPETRILPKSIKSCFSETGFQAKSSYLGDVN